MKKKGNPMKANEKGSHQSMKMEANPVKKSNDSHPARLKTEEVLVDKAKSNQKFQVKLNQKPATTVRSDDLYDAFDDIQAPNNNRKLNQVFNEFEMNKATDDRPVCTYTASLLKIVKIKF